VINICLINNVYKEGDRQKQEEKEKQRLELLKSKYLLFLYIFISFLCALLQSIIYERIIIYFYLFQEHRFIG